MFNNEDILMAKKKPIIFNIVYAGNSFMYKVYLNVSYTNPTTGQKVTYPIRYGDSYSFPCAIGDTVELHRSTDDPLVPADPLLVYTSGGRAPSLEDFHFDNGVDVSPTRGGFNVEGGSSTFTITGKSPFLNYYIDY